MNESPRDCVTRRRFLSQAASMAIGVGAASQVQAAQVAPTSTQPTSRPATGGDSWDGTRSLVVEALSDHVLGVAGVQLTQLRDMLRKSLGALTGRSSVEEAWQTLLKPDDVVAIKFNKVAATVLNITDPFALILLESLKAAGFAPEKIVAFDLSERQCEELGCTFPVSGFSDEVVEFECGRDSFAAALQPVTALINVAFAKTHHLATMTGCLKNVSHGLIRRPSQFHDNGCDPAIGCIVASPPIRDRLRVNFINAIRVISNGGSRAAAKDVSDYGRIAVSCDPVALDSWALEQLNSVRTVRGLGPLLPSPRVPSWLVSAAERGLGQFDSERMTVKRLRV